MKYNRILIVSHDAGGAYLLSKWCNDYKSRCHFTYYLSGPAVSIFKDEINNINIISEIELFDTDCVITTTGWQTNFEKDAIELAKLNGIYVCSYLDHWANYKSRFIKDRDILIPDEIWCADQDALIIAKKEFKELGSKFRLIRNRHLSQFIRKVNNFDNYKSSILICLEPIRDGQCSIELYEFLASYLSNNFSVGSHVIIRNHPSEVEKNLDNFVSMLDKNFNVEISNNELAYDLSISSCIFGYQTSVLVYALKLNKKVYSFFPVKRIPSSLPHSGINYINYQ